ncbi:hypothetical protein [Thermosphaera aggregans]|uniref:hypothetical protein n=1 Tax=Thermosphaera aggregans TaxID=54254 RepID=UPI001494C12C|nr:hypothetical protein [Thermosphaera aggregans]
MDAWKAPLLSEPPRPALRGARSVAGAVATRGSLRPGRLGARIPGIWADMLEALPEKP